MYAVGHRGLTERGRRVAALLAAGDRAALSHASALVVWGLARGPLRPVHLTVAGDAGRHARPGLVVHRSRTLAPDDVVRREGLPVTTARRTLADVRPRTGARRFGAIVRRAEILRLDIGPIDGWDDRDPDATEIERRMAAVGVQVLRFPWRQVTRDPVATGTTIARVLAARGA